MIGNLTLTNIAEGMALILGLIAGFGTLYVKLKNFLEKVIKDQIKDLSDDLKTLDIETCKNFLVRCIADMERGDELSETEKERFHEQYKHYRDKGGNTYIEAKVEKLKAAGKL